MRFQKGTPRQLNLNSRSTVKTNAHACNHVRTAPDDECDHVEEMQIIIQPYLVEQCQMKALKLFGVKLHGQGWGLSCEIL